jgi:hypothetical protein
MHHHYNQNKHNQSLNREKSPIVPTTSALALVVSPPLPPSPGRAAKADQGLLGDASDSAAP